LDEEWISTPAVYYKDKDAYSRHGWCFYTRIFKLAEEEEKEEDYYIDSFGFRTCKKNWDKWLI
jgi:hypothetical protein